MTTTKQKIIKLEKQLKNLNEILKQERSEKEFKCICGNVHKTKDCEAIQEHWYESPYSCTDGDYWHEGELNILCPSNDLINEVIFKSKYDIPYNKRNILEYSAEMQFKYIYKYLFKTIHNNYDKYHNRYFLGKPQKIKSMHFFDENREYFDLSIKGVDDKENNCND